MLSLALAFLTLLLLSIPVSAVVALVGHALWTNHELVCVGTAILVLGSGVAGATFGADPQLRSMLYAVATFSGALALPVSHGVGRLFMRYRPRRADGTGFPMDAPSAPKSGSRQGGDETPGG